MTNRERPEGQNRSYDDRQHQSLDTDEIEVIQVNSSSAEQYQTNLEPTGVKRLSQLSEWGQRFSRPLSFNGSIWLKEPEDIVPQFVIVGTEIEPQQNSDIPHHVFSRNQKKQLVCLVSVAAMFSPLSSNIYFPATVAISEALHTPVELIALTITIYMLFQGLAPSFWGPLTDNYGRRPILLATLLVYILANLGLALSPSFAALMLFRGIQAMGSASTIAIGAGVIGDIAIAAERGGLMGLFGGIRMFGQAFGPVIGGTLAQYLGFRSIFWFLLCLAILVTFLLFLFLPETLRSIAGNGDRRLYSVYRPIIKPPRGPEIRKEDRYKPEKLSFSNFLEIFQLLWEKDVLITLIFGGFTYAVWSMITSSTASLFKEEYELSDVLIGLCFLPNGIGCILGSLVTGKLMDRDYKREATRYCIENGIPEGTELKQEDYPNFPIERARLGSIFVLNAVFVLATALYGSAVEWHIAIPLMMQLLTAFTATAIFNINSTLMIDLYPSKPASATAINNLVRCTMGGIGVGFIEKSIDAIDEGPVFLLLAFLSWISFILIVVEQKWGPEWRQQRLMRLKSTSDK